MHWELWALNAGNLIRDFESEDEARAVVCGLLADGWQPADLGVVLEWDDGEEGDSHGSRTVFVNAGALGEPMLVDGTGS